MLYSIAHLILVFWKSVKNKCKLPYVIKYHSMTARGDFLRRIGVAILQLLFFVFIVLFHANIGTSSLPVTPTLTTLLLLILIQRRLSPTHGSNLIDYSILNTLLSSGALFIFFLATQIPRLPAPEFISTAPSQAPTSAPTQFVDFLPMPPPPDTKQCSFINYDPSLSMIANTTESINNNLKDAHFVFKSGCSHIQNETLGELASLRFASLRFTLRRPLRNNTIINFLFSFRSRPPS